MLFRQIEILTEALSRHFFASSRRDPEKKIELELTIFLTKASFSLFILASGCFQFLSKYLKPKSV